MVEFFAIIIKLEGIRMNFLCTFHIGALRILNKNCSVQGHVTLVQKSYLYIIKKPIRLYVNDRNTMFSHYITFQYTVENQTYLGKLFLNPYIRCPRKGEEITVYYDPEKPQNYACRIFERSDKPIGW